ncbi:MAG: hypothetical protein ACREPT_08280 [Rudaea sp.]
MKRTALLAPTLALPLLLSACGKHASDSPASSPAAATSAAAAPAPPPPPGTIPHAPAEAAPAPPPTPLGPGDAIDYTTVALARAALSKRTDVQSREEDGWFIVADQSTSALWSFTPPDDAANPTVVKRTIHEKNGVVSVAMATLCEAPKAACNELTRKFEDINVRMQADLQHQHDRHKK